jgi:hypothetical protein
MDAMYIDLVVRANHAMRRRGATYLVALALLALLSACGKSHYDYIYQVSSMENGTTCVTLVSGLARGTESDHVCEKWPSPQVIANRPIRVGDCVVVRTHPEGGAAQLILTDPAKCVAGRAVSAPAA